MREGDTGFLVDTVQQAAAAVKRLGELDPQACRANVEARFSVEEMAVGYERVFWKVIEETGSGVICRNGPSGASHK